MYLAVHILAAVIWVGGDVMLQAIALRVFREDDPKRLVAFTADVAWVGTRLLVPSSLILVLFGFMLVSKGNWPYDFWIVAAIVVWAASAVTGSVFLGPESGRISRLAVAEGAESPEVTARIRRVVAISRVEMILLILIVIDMVLKPGT
ncbi:MAG: DUF2269 family protein [Solirubrobacterales bacterium]